MKEVLCKMNYSAGRMGNLSGIFICTEDQIKWLMSINKDVYFGEVLGKHSEIYGPIEEKDIEIVTEDKNVIKIIKEYNLENGINPFDYEFLSEDVDWGEDFENLTVLETYNKIKGL